MKGGNGHMKTFISGFGPALSLYTDPIRSTASRLFRSGPLSLTSNIGLESLSTHLESQDKDMRAPVPEVVVLGRSNVGKSSLVNALFREKIARTSKTPGRTQRLFFYNLSNELVLVDAPGYGFAEAPEKAMEEWVKLSQRYLQQTKRLKLVLCLVNAQHGVKIRDQKTFDFLESIRRPFLIVLTKADKVATLPTRLHTVYTATKHYTSRIDAVHAVSARSDQGLDLLRAAIVRYAL